MDIRQELKDLYFKRKLINSYTRQLKDIEEIGTTLPPVYSSDDKVQTSRKTGSKIEDYVVAKMELEDKIKVQKADTIESMNLVKDLLNGLNVKEKLIIELRYMEGMEWYQICDETGYSSQHSFAIHKKALKLMEKNYKNIHQS